MNALTAARRNEVASKLSITPAALWAWTDEDLLKAAANGTTQTDAGVVINEPRCCDLCSTELNGPRYITRCDPCSDDDL